MISIADIRSAIHGRDRDLFFDVALFAFTARRGTADEPVLDYLIALSTPRWVDQWVTEMIHSAPDQQGAAKDDADVRRAEVAAFERVEKALDETAGWSRSSPFVLPAFKKGTCSLGYVVYHTATFTAPEGWPTAKDEAANPRFDKWAQAQAAALSKHMAQRVRLYSMLIAQGFPSEVVGACVRGICEIE